MKKVFAMILAVALVMSMSLAVSATVSPEGTSFHKVYVIDGPGADADVNKVPVGDEITLTADPKKGDFDKWMFYTMDGSPAVEGEDYVIVEGKADSATITIVPLSNIIVTANYNGKITKVEIKNDEPFSPATGDTTVYALGAVMVLALAGAAVAKKQMAK